MITTKMGVMALITPVIELSNFVCAMAKRKAGKKLPFIPKIKSTGNFALGSLGKLLIATGAKDKKAIVILSAPSSPGENTKRLFLIKINEVPQIRAMDMSMIQAMGLLPLDPSFIMLK